MVRYQQRQMDEVLMYVRRILPSDEVSVVGRLTDAMIDLTSRSFHVPVIDKYSPLAYSIVNKVHWFNKNTMNMGVETVWREVLKVAYIIEGRQIVKQFRRSCERCKYINKKTIDVIMSPVSQHNITIAPPFYITQVDLAGSFKTFSKHNQRSIIKVWMAVFCCCTTSTVSIKIMENYNSASFIQVFVRFSCKVSYPKMLLPDEGSQLVNSCKSMEFNFTDLKNNLHRSKVEFDVCPIGGHYMHGKVERKIQEVKRSLKKRCNNERLSIIEWETFIPEVSNCINDMPLALGNIISDFESMDLITPNRLRIGRNNARSPDGTLEVTCKLEKFLRLNEKISQFMV